MKHLRNINIWRILKILCIVLCAVFLFAACDGDQTGPNGADKQTAIEEARSSGSDCIQASLLGMMYNGLGEMAAKVYSDLSSEDLLSLLMLAFSVWMAFQILRHVSSPAPESLAEFWTKVLRKAAICMACGVLASSQQNILYAVNTFVMPVYVTILEFASSILAILGADEAKPLVITGTVAEDIGGTIEEPVNYQMGQCTINTEEIKMTEKEFPPSIVDLMGCMACSVSDRLNVGYTVALLMMCSGNFFAVLVAVFLFVAFTIVKWGFALYLIDSIFRMTMMITIMPFLILFFPFEQTRKWTVTGFKVILNSAAIMLCLAMLIGMTIYAMDKMFTSPSFGDFGAKETYENLGTVSLAMMFMGFVIIKVAGLAVSLSDKVTGGGGEARFQKKIQQLVAVLAHALVLIISHGGSSTVQSAMTYAQRIRNIVEKIQKAKAKIEKAKQAMNKMAGRQKQGGQGEGGEA